MNNPPDIQNTHVDFSCNAAESVVIAEIISGTPHSRKLFEQLQPEDFNTKKHAKLFDNLRKSAEAGTIEDYSIRLIEAGHLPDPSREMRVWDAAGAIVANSSKRALLSALTESHQQLMDPTEGITSLQESVRNRLIDAMDPRTADLPEEFGNSIEAARKDMESTGVAMTTGITALDRMLHITDDSFVVLAARPSQGKTALGMSIILNNLMAGKRPAFASMEMNDRSIIKRLVAMISGVPFERIVKGWLGMNEHDARRVKDAYDQVQGFLNHVDKHWLFCSKKMTVQQVRDWLELTRPGFAVLDYGQLMKSTRPMGSRREELSEVTGDLRGLSSDFGIPIICLAQLNRTASHEERPQMAKIKDSGSFEQDATDVVLIDRPESGASAEPVKRNYRDPLTGENLVLVSEDGKATGNACLLIDKQRNGACGYCPVKFDGPTMRFYDFPTEAPNW